MGGRTGIARYYVRDAMIYEDRAALIKVARDVRRAPARRGGVGRLKSRPRLLIFSGKRRGREREVGFSLSFPGDGRTFRWVGG